MSGIVGEWWLCNGETKPIKLRQDRIASGVAGITHSCFKYKRIHSWK